MRASIYNLYLKDHTGMVIYNARKDEIIALHPQLADLFEEGNGYGDAEQIRRRHPELMAYLIEKGIFVEDGIDEAADYVSTRRQADAESEEFTITVNPTLACNMKCWYCYESHKGMTAMKAEVRRSVVALINKVAFSGRYNKLHLSFFGGEPLLCFDSVVGDLLRAAKSACISNGVTLYVHFTTNAYLLTTDMLDQMRGMDVSFQITIDGNEHVHNSVRMTKSGLPTYASIVRNVLAAVSNRFHVGVRFNYTHQSLPSFIDVLAEFRNIGVEQKRLLNFNFQRVWQDSDGDVEAVERLVAEIERAFEEAGLYVNHASDYYVPYCYADKVNTVVVNYNGELFKCTARDFASKNKEGVLGIDGELCWNSRYKKRLSVMNGTSFCLRCKIYPICHGGCSQMKLESVVSDACPKGYAPERIAEIMKGRAMFLLNQYKTRGVHGIQQ